MIQIWLSTSENEPAKSKNCCNWSSCLSFISLLEICKALRASYLNKSQLCGLSQTAVPKWHWSKANEWHEIKAIHVHVTQPTCLTKGPVTLCVLTTQQRWSSKLAPLEPNIYPCPLLVSRHCERWLGNWCEETPCHLHSMCSIWLQNLNLSTTWHRQEISALAKRESRLTFSPVIFGMASPKPSCPCSAAGE